MLSILKAGALATLFCLHPTGCLDTVSVKALVEQELANYPRKEEVMKVIACESSFDPLIQSQHKDLKGPNGLENSWGLVQINLDHNPQVSLTEALDWQFSLRFIQKEFAAGLESHWTCWRNRNEITYGR